MNATRQRDTKQTRAELLEAAFREVYEYGFQAASLERILRNTRLTKGALYHHFPNKQAMGLAVVEEVVGERMRRRYVAPLMETDDPIPMLIEAFRLQAEAGMDKTMRCGCPLNNLSQEMSGLDEEFRTHLRGIFEEWRQALTHAFERGQKQGNVRAEANAEAVATFIIAVHEGMIGLGKTYRDPKILQQSAWQLQGYLESLIP